MHAMGSPGTREALTFLARVPMREETNRVGMNVRESELADGTDEVGELSPGDPAEGSGEPDLRNRWEER
jgi:hypothetical protein